MLKKFTFLFVIPFVLAGCSEPVNNENSAYISSESEAPAQTGVDLPGSPINDPVIDHLHGIAILPDGDTLAVATHSGIFLWGDEQWYDSKAVKHDYMGFTASGEAFYTSGHPAPGSGLPNPLGFMKSVDAGRTWQPLSLMAEADFHLMVASFDDSTIYAWNMGRNSQMVDRGLYYTRDGSQWKKSAMNGVNADPLVLTAHPFKEGTLLVSTLRDTYMSSDFGDTFELLFEDAFITVGDFVKDADILVAGTMDSKGQTKMIRHDFAKGEKTELNVPPLGKNEVIAYMAVSPEDADIIFIATPRRNIFVSRDGGMTWDQILKD